MPKAEPHKRWGDVCGSSVVASQWADALLPIVRSTWEETRQGAFSYFNGTRACLSCLLVAGRYQELLDLVDIYPHVSWNYRKYGVDALIAMGKKGDAIAYAKASCGLNDNPIAIDQVCEAILISSGLHEEVFEDIKTVIDQDTSPGLFIKHVLGWL